MKELIEALLIIQKYLKNPNYQKITITHSKNDILYQDDIIYNDKFISQISSEVIEKKLDSGTSSFLDTK